MIIEIVCINSPSTTYRQRPSSRTLLPQTVASIGGLRRVGFPGATNCGEIVGENREEFCSQWIGLVGKILTGNHGFYH